MSAKMGSVHQTSDTGAVKVLVAYASKTGSTKEIAEFIGKRLQKGGLQAEVKEVGTVDSVAGYDAFVVGSAVYMYHWLKEAVRFISRNRAILTTRPVWIFSSGPTGPRSTDSKGRDLKEVSGPKELDELRRAVNPRGHAVFFGALFPDRLKGATGFFARRIPKEETGDFRDWGEIEVWVDGVAGTLSAHQAAAKRSDSIG